MSIKRQIGTISIGNNNLKCTKTNPSATPKVCPLATNTTVHRVTLSITLKNKKGISLVQMQQKAKCVSVKETTMNLNMINSNTLHSKVQESESK